MNIDASDSKYKFEDKSVVIDEKLLQPVTRLISLSASERGGDKASRERERETPLKLHQ